MICPNCGNNVVDNSKFCDSCGAQIPEILYQPAPQPQPAVEPTPVYTEAPAANAPAGSCDPAPANEAPAYFCPNCGQQNAPGSAFCERCGLSFVSAAPAPSKKKGMKKGLLFGLIGGAAAVIAVVLLLIFLPGKGQTPNYGLYLKDDEIYYTALSKPEPFQITAKLLDTDEDELSGTSFSSELALLCRISPDGKYLFFPDKIEEDGFSLYYRELKKDAEPVKIDSDVVMYITDKDCSHIFYFKGSNPDLYLYDRSKDEKEKIASSVQKFFPSENGKLITYLDDEDRLYLKEIGKDAVKIAGDVEEITYGTADLSRIYFQKNGSLYCSADGKEAEKIAGDIEDVVRICEDGSMYYYKTETKEIPLADLVEDDMADLDAILEEPVYPDYPDRPYSFEYKTQEEYDAALAAYDKAYEEYEKAKDAYDEAWDQYWDKENRYDLREKLKDETLEQYIITLYYYDGKTETVVSDSITSEYGRFYPTCAADAATLIFSTSVDTEIAKVKISEIDSIYDIENKFDDAQSELAKTFVVIGENMAELDIEKAEHYELTDDGKMLYYWPEAEDEDVYCISLAGGTPGEAKLYDSDISYYDFRLLNGKPVYLKDDEALYLDKEKIADDVAYSSLDYLEEKDLLLFLSDVDEEEENGTLNIYQNGKKTKIADDVTFSSVLPNGEVLYLSDYSTKHQCGDLYLYRGGKSEKIDTDVTAIIPVIDALTIANILKVIMN